MRLLIVTDTREKTCYVNRIAIWSFFFLFVSDFENKHQRSWRKIAMQGTHQPVSWTKKNTFIYILNRSDKFELRFPELNRAELDTSIFELKLSCIFLYIHFLFYELLNQKINFTFSLVFLIFEPENQLFWEEKFVHYR